MTLIPVTQKEVREALYSASHNTEEMEHKAGGQTLDSLAESAFTDYLHTLKKALHDGGGFEIRLNLRDVFLAGYTASEERKWK
jgi:hypothetical protein